jgi:23S rRNA (adenine2503-C2)-methyltransferase
MRLIRDIPIADLDNIVASMDQPAYRTKQLRLWLYAERARSWDEMSNLPAKWRQMLAESYRLSGLEVQERQVSADGTRKHLFSLHDGKLIEAVTIPMDGHLTFCISSQVGCAMGCTFCATAIGGLERNLTPGEIIEQVLLLIGDQETDPLPRESGREFNIVFMGMGEPLANFNNIATAIETLCDPEGMGISSRRITLSTSGYGPGMKKLLQSGLKVGLTLSLNSTSDMERRKIMPVPGKTPITEAMDLAARYGESRRRTITIAYVLIQGINDRPEDAKRLAGQVSKKSMKINLIPYNGIGSELKAPTRQALSEFQGILTGMGIRNYIRLSNGEDIDAACGQLRSRHTGNL